MKYHDRQQGGLSSSTSVLILIMHAHTHTLWATYSFFLSIHYFSIEASLKPHQLSFFLTHVFALLCQIPTAFVESSIKFHQIIAKQIVQTLAKQWYNEQGLLIYEVWSWCFKRWQTDGEGFPRDKLLRRWQTAGVEGCPMLPSLFLTPALSSSQQVR